MGVARSPWIAAVLAFATVYLAVGVLFPNPPAGNPTQFAWRLAAWLTCAVAFVTHVGLEDLRFRNSPTGTAFHAAMAVALGAFGLAGAANVHALLSGAGNGRLLAIALAVWPAMTAVPAFLVAFAAAVGLRGVRRRGQ